MRLLLNPANHDHRLAEIPLGAAKRLDILERTHAAQTHMLEAAANRPLSRDDLLDRLRGGGF